MTTTTSPTIGPTMPTGPLAGLGALVTGGSRGIGRATVSRLAAEGASVVFTYCTDRAQAEGLVDEIAAAGGRAHALRLDLADLDRLAAVFTEAEDIFSGGGAGLDILIASAGVAATTPISEVTETEWDRVMAINAKGPFFAVQHAARRMRDRGRIIILSTVTTAWPSPGEALYAASKAAGEQLSRVASRELGHRQITVNTVSPGPTDTELLRASAPAETLAGAAAMTALGRLGQPHDIADVVAVLARPASGWITGQNIRADGGLV